MNNLVLKAKNYATTAHKDQKYSEFPYTIHLQAVESVLIRFGITDETLLACAWLHDVLEDTPTTYEDLQTFFGQKIADIVSALSEPKGGNRKWRHEQTYPRIRQNVNAVIVKLADRIANVEAGGPKLNMYRKEYSYFKQQLVMTASIDWQITNKIDDMWHHLENIMINVPAVNENG